MENYREIGGNGFYLWLGNLLSKWGKKLTNKGSKTTISNPTSKFIGPFAIKIDFTVNNTDKYQLIIQGDYKTKYKESNGEDKPMNEDEMFMVIISNKSQWFYKN